MTSIHQRLIALLRFLGVIAVEVGLIAGCSLVPTKVEAKTVLEKAFNATDATQPATSAPVPDSKSYVLTRREEYHLKTLNLPDPYHQDGIKTDTETTLQWVTSDGKSKVQQIDPKSQKVILEVTTVTENGKTLQHMRSVLSAVEFTVVFETPGSTDKNTIDAERNRRRQYIDALSANADMSMQTYTATQRSAYHISSKLSDATLKSQKLEELRLTYGEALGAIPSDVRQVYDVDAETYEILASSVVAIFPDGAEKLVESSKVMSRSVGALSDLPGTLFAIPRSQTGVQVLGFDIHNEVALGHALERIHSSGTRQVVSVISGPAQVLAAGLRSAAPVWDTSEPVMLTARGQRLPAWLCKGGVLASSPVRRVLIVEIADQLYYITGQSFGSDIEFLSAAQAELGQ